MNGTTPATPPVPEQARSGRLVEWDAQKGFGFLHDGTNRIYINRRDFRSNQKEPARGDTLAFVIGHDFTGRVCAKQAVIVASVGRIHGKQLGLLLLLLIAPGFAIHSLTTHLNGFLLTSAAVIISAATFLVYAWDKHRARLGGRRVAESTLHLLSLLGGWPGAYLAQHRLRHKTAKTSFLILFWFTVLIHQYVAIDYTLGWRISDQVVQLLRGGA